MIQRTDATVQALTPIKTTEINKNWQQALAESITDPEQLIQLLQLPPSILPQLQRAGESFQLRVPRPFLDLMEPGNLNDPLLLQVLPQAQELLSQPGYLRDPLQEANHNPQRGIIHKYHGRVLLTLSGACAVNCRYCFRRHFPYQDNQLGSEQWQQVLDYLRQHPEVQEVIFSGGDPLATPDNRIFKMLDDLEQLPQLRRLRIHSRLPVVIPQRLTDALSQRLQQSRLQVVLVLHINHSNEISVALQQQLQPLQRGGITLLNQSVLLKGVNDNSDTLVHLSEQLFASGILPYYLYLLDPVEGAAHFDLDETRARLLAGQMAARLPGYLVPKLARDIPGKAAKTQILPLEADLG
ncbi:MAG: EF-P beta-lysylation protein EpmB [Motiliproteus sp.]